MLRVYREPSGHGVRVDGNGYTGYRPPPQFDPLLAKVVVSISNPTSTFADVAKAGVASAHTVHRPRPSVHALCWRLSRRSDQSLWAFGGEVI